MKPDFLVIGAARSGTTSLFQYLDRHPDIQMSAVKELNFFSNDTYWRKGFDWYERRFPRPVSEHSALGEASTSYTRSPFTTGVAERIHRYRPDIKLIYVVRDPVERFVSQYMQRTRAGRETRPFEETLNDLEKEPAAWQGRYYYQLQQYLPYFPREQILVVSFDAIKRAPSRTISEVIRFLDVPEHDIGETQSTRVHNAADSVIRKNRFGLAVMAIYHDYIEQRAIPFPLKRFFRRLAELGGTPVQKPSLSPEQRHRLEAFYRTDSHQLSEEFGIATDHWFSMSHAAPEPDSADH